MATRPPRRGPGGSHRGRTRWWWSSGPPSSRPRSCPTARAGLHPRGRPAAAGSASRRVRPSPGRPRVGGLRSARPFAARRRRRVAGCSANASSISTCPLGANSAAISSGVSFLVVMPRASGGSRARRADRRCVDPCSARADRRAPTRVPGTFQARSPPLPRRHSSACRPTDT